MTSQATQALDIFFRANPQSFGGVSQQHIDAVKESLIFVDGGLAHADLSPVANRVPVRTLIGLMGALGVPPKKFFESYDARCTGTPGICFVFPNSWCDEERCHRR